MPHYQLETSRLILRQWQDSDFAKFAQLNANSQVMQYFPHCLSCEESNLLATRFHNLIEQNQWGFWAVELKATQQFIGFVGLHSQPERFLFSPCVEIGWRLDQKHWHQGYATEAAYACLLFAFEYLKLTKIVSFTACVNLASTKVMQRLKMNYIQTFNHPNLMENHPLSQHVLYEITQDQFRLNTQKLNEFYIKIKNL